MRGSWALIRSTWAMWLQYRSFFFILAFGWMIPPLIYLLVWSTAAGEGQVGGFNRGEFVAYYLALIVVNQLTYAQTNWTVGDLIRYGQMNRVLLRPLHPIFEAISTEVAGKVVYMAFIGPAVIILGLVLRPEWHIASGNWLAFIPALAMAWALRFFWGYWLALLAFWAARADALLNLQDALIFLLAGQVAPIALLPAGLQTAANILPFRYMLAFPVEVLTGQLDFSGMVIGFLVQFAWLIATVALYKILWRVGLQRYTAVGG